jgi:hypothetical protein
MLRLWDPRSLPEAFAATLDAATAITTFPSNVRVGV